MRRCWLTCHVLLKQDSSYYIKSCEIGTGHVFSTLCPSTCSPCPCLASQIKFKIYWSKELLLHVCLHGADAPTSRRRHQRWTRKEKEVPRKRKTRQLSEHKRSHFSPPVIFVIYALPALFAQAHF